VNSPLVVSPELLALAAGESAGVLYITDLGHRVVWVNSAFERATGFTLDEVGGRVPTVLLGGDVADESAMDSIIRTLNAGERVSTSMVLHRKDGTSFWSALAIAPLRDTAGMICGYLTNCIDITPAKTAEQRLANIIAGTRAGTWEWNVQTGEVHFNERWAEIVGYRLDELQPISIDTWMSVAHPDDLPKSTALLARHFAGESDHYECLCRMRHRDGRDVWVQDRGHVVEWTHDGKPLWMAGTHIDVTDMVLTSEALRQARDRAQHVLDTVQSVILWLDRDGRVVQLNPAGCTLVGIAEQAIRGRNWFTEFHPPEHIEQLVVSYRQLMQGGIAELPFTENEIVTVHGTRRLLRWHHVLQRDEQGLPVGLLSSGDDITDLRQLERLSTRRQRLEAIGTLAGGIAHDLNNALSPAVMGMGVLREAAPSEHVLIDMIESSTNRAAQMVRQLLTFARGADGERRTLDAPVVVREVERLIRTTFPKNISLSVQLPDDTPRILGDATQLHQVLVNLAVNARDAMSNGGLLAITLQPVEVGADEASRVSVTAARAGRYLRIAVRDTGEGIEEGLLDRIFDPFYTTKGPERGTGLGLSTVLGIVKGHGGFLQAESRPGIGSTFNVFLPLPDGLIPPTPVIAEPHRADATGLVLFVDDEPFIRSMAIMLANRIGCAATTASSTDEALALLRKAGERISTVVTDLHMPGRDGLTLTREIREQWPDLPVVIVSGLMTDELLRKVREIPYVSVLPKPFSEVQLREALARTVPIADAGLPKP
jgi:PAS domain S-box-containing protein